MFVRVKRTGAYEYLQIVESNRSEGKVRQRVIATLGRLDQLRDSGQIDALVSSCARFAEKTAVLDAHRMAGPRRWLGRRRGTGARVTGVEKAERFE